MVLIDIHLRGWRARIAQFASILIVVLVFTLCAYGLARIIAALA